MNKKIYRYLIILILLLAAFYFARPLIFKKVPLKETELNVIKYFPFNKENSLKEWEEKIFKGKVVYKVECNKENFVKGVSIKTASALYCKIKMDIEKSPVISWKWRIKKFPNKEKPERLDLEAQDDFAARVYVIFPAVFFTNSKVLEYIWADETKIGTVASSPYTKNIQLFVLRSGKENSNEFVFEERDIYQDYLKAFGKPPKLQIGAIAFMTDADSTSSEAIGEYADIKLGYKKMLVNEK